MKSSEVRIALNRGLTVHKSVCNVHAILEDIIFPLFSVVAPNKGKTNAFFVPMVLKIHQQLMILKTNQFCQTNMQSKPSAVDMFLDIWCL